jgi:hypothetical protein
MRTVGLCTGAALLFAVAAAGPVHGDPPADGFYRGGAVGGEARNVEVGERLELRIDEAVLVAQDNENTTFGLHLRVPYDASLSSSGTLRLVVGGNVVASSGAGSSGTTWSHPSFVTHGREAAAAIARFLGIEPRLRRHPGHRLRVEFVPEAQKVDAWKPPHVTLRMTNVGDGPVAFVKGGRNRAARDNQYDFLARRRGRVVLDVGTNLHFGGLSVRRTLAPGETFEEGVDLAKWFAFDEPGLYEIVGTYALTLLDPGADDQIALWEDFATARFSVEVVPATGAGEGLGHGAPDGEGAVVGPWTPVVGGLRARLVTSLDDVDRGAPFISVYVELENVHAYASDVVIGADRIVEIEVLDETMKPLQPSAHPFDGPVTAPAPIVLPDHSRMRYKLSSGGCGAPPDAAIVCLVEKSWVLRHSDRRTFYVRGTLRRDGADGWVGRLDLLATPVDRQRE